MRDETATLAISFFSFRSEKVAQILSENVRTPMQHSVKLHRL
ncbi:hypothetical protein NBRC111894_4657 [Sporolactobacillus inulinus]|uniref:Uncharacterized protein n=1 Tax=Sporolactobacillus inulinus TaxID=2078 RepID=A0A4Y1ZJM8_9BACL|nr:hypothetical protein NBRC111894_4657 [Sporolactobacillus inulinus]